MDGTAGPRFWNVPNSLTLARLALAVGVFVAVSYGYYLTALAVFVVAAATDALDGYFARLLGQSSALGRQLDPLVDKVVVAAILIFLLPVEGTGLAPWMVVAVVVRELVVQALRSLIEARGVAFGARWSGKFKTAFQCFAVVGILLVLGLGPTAPQILIYARDVTIWTAVVLTIYSGAIYLRVAWPLLHG